MDNKMTKQEKKVLAIRIGAGIVCAVMIVGILYMLVSGLIG